jgi:hypothetical protein
MRRGHTLARQRQNDLQVESVHEATAGWATAANVATLTDDAGVARRT